MLISDLWGISFHAVVVFGLGKNLLFKYILELWAKTSVKEEFVNFVKKGIEIAK